MYQKAVALRKPEKRSSAINRARPDTITCDGQTKHPRALCAAKMSKRERMNSVLVAATKIICTMNSFNGGRMDWKMVSKAAVCRSVKTIRRYLFEKKGLACWKCGWCQINPVTQRVPLQVNHIDGDPLNNKEENLELICPNCHSVTPTFGALNKGKGRAIRRQRYHQKNGAPDGTRTHISRIPIAVPDQLEDRCMAGLAGIEPAPSST